MCDERESERQISMYMFVKCEREKEQNIKQHKTNEKKTARCYTLQFLCCSASCECVLRQNTKIVWENYRIHKKNMYGNFPHLWNYFFLPSLFTQFKVFFLNTHFFLFELDNYHLFYIHSYLLIISLYTSISISSHEIFISVTLCERDTCLHT